MVHPNPTTTSNTLVPNAGANRNRKGETIEFRQVFFDLDTQELAPVNHRKYKGSNQTSFQVLPEKWVRLRRFWPSARPSECRNSVSSSESGIPGFEIPWTSRKAPWSNTQSSLPEGNQIWDTFLDPAIRRFLFNPKARFIPTLECDDLVHIRKTDQIHHHLTTWGIPKSVSRVPLYPERDVVLNSGRKNLNLWVKRITDSVRHELDTVDLTLNMSKEENRDVLTFYFGVASISGETPAIPLFVGEHLALSGRNRFCGLLGWKDHRFIAKLRYIRDRVDGSYRFSFAADIWGTR